MQPETPQITFNANQRGHSYGSTFGQVKPPETAASTTLDLVRAFGQLETPSTDPARELAEHLIDDETATLIWPGNMLSDFFANTSDQNQLRPRELKALACIVEGILIQLTDSTNADTPEPAEQSDEEKLRLPDLTHFDQLGLNQSAGFPEIFFEHMQCDCMDWQTVRRKLAADSPGRLCKHLSRLIHLNAGRAPTMSPPLRRLLDWAGETYRPLPPHPKWRLLSDDPEPIIAAWGARGTCSVFANSTGEKFTRFTYDLRSRQWTDNQRPAQIDSPAVRSFLAEVIASDN